MKHVYPLTFALLLFAGTALAQISHGGQPHTFEATIAAHLRATVPTEHMPAVDLAALQAEDAITDQHKDIVWRFGKNNEVDLGIDNAGRWEELEKGNRIWRLRIQSQGALSLNFQFSEFELPEGATLFLYNDDHTDVLGALTNNNNKEWGTLGTTLIAGDAVTLEYYEPAAVAGQGKLRVGTVTHGYRSVVDYPHYAINGRDLGDSGNCNNNVICPEGDDWRDHIRSVAMIVVNGDGICTGAMINNTCEDETPYFLTADHCLGNVQNWVFRFNWESPDCNQNQNGPTNQTVSGASLVASNSASDFGLLELSSAPPVSYDVYYAGWDRSGAAPTSSVCIHHPSGDIKKISFDNDASSTTVFQGVDSWHIQTWEDGTTEGGSSGAPLFNQNGLIIGQLYGGTASCGNNVDDYYGRFDVSWDNGNNASSRLSDWLDGCATGAVSLGGLGEAVPTVALDAQAAGIDGVDDLICGADPFWAQVKIRNKGADVLTQATVTWTLNGGLPQTATWGGSLQFNEFDTYNLPPLTPQHGQNTLMVTISDPNAGTDLDPSNDQFTITFEARLDAAAYELVLQTDQWGEEVTWDIEDDNGTVVLSGGPYSNGGILIEQDLCLSPDCYTFTIYDDANDGMTGSFWNPANGEYQLLDDNGTTFVNETGDSYTDQQSHDFCVDGIPFGLEELSDFAQINLFPNPTDGWLSLSIVANQPGVANVTITNVLGAQVAAHRVPYAGATTQPITLLDQAPGIYFVTVQIDDRVATQRIVLR